MERFAWLLGVCAAAAIAAPSAAGASVYRVVPAPSAEELTRQRIFLLERRLDRLEDALREPRSAATSVVMLGSPQPPLLASPWWSAGWWGVPVVRSRGWHVRPFPPHGGPPLTRPRPLPQPIAAPMRFQNPRAGAGSGPHR